MIGIVADRSDAPGRDRTRPDFQTGSQVMIAESRLLARDMPSFW